MSKFAIQRHTENLEVGLIRSQVAGLGGGNPSNTKYFSLNVAEHNKCVDIQNKLLIFHVSYLHTAQELLKGHCGSVG